MSVNVCPRSDAHYALEDGMCAFQIARDYDIKPGLSVDNESSYSGDLFMEMRVAFYLQRSITQGRRYLGHHSVPDAVMVQDLLEAATISGARVAGLEDRTGSLSPGKQADIVLIRTGDLNLELPPSEWSVDYDSLDRGRDDECLRRSTSPRRSSASYVK